MAEFGAAFPALEILGLNPEPLQLTTPKITLHSLLVVAQHFSNLLYLGIYLDAQETTTPKTHSSIKTGLFPNLLTLHVGVSPIASEISVAIFLSHLLLDNERVEVWSRVSDSVVGHNATMVSERRKKWDQVANTLPVLFQQLKEEKAYRQDLEKEVEDLRMKNDVIMEKV